MYCVYILYSKSLDMFYVGETVDLSTRLHEHNSGKYKNAYTAKAKDWDLFCRLDCSNREIARRIERHIKQMKSRIYFQNLIKYLEISEKLIKRYT